MVDLKKSTLQTSREQAVGLVTLKPWATVELLAGLVRSVPRTRLELVPLKDQWELTEMQDSSWDRSTNFGPDPAPHRCCDTQPQLVSSLWPSCLSTDPYRSRDRHNCRR